MNLKSWLSASAILFALLPAPSVASTLAYDVYSESDFRLDFQLPSNPVPFDVTATSFTAPYSGTGISYGFGYGNLNITVTDGAVTFSSNSLSFGNGLNDNIGVNGLFSGSPANPTLLAGAYVVSDLHDGNRVNINVTNESIGSEFDSLYSSYLPPGVGVTSQELSNSQSTALYDAESTASFITQNGTSASISPLDEKIANLTPLADDALGIALLLAGGPGGVVIDDELQIDLICPNSSCTIEPAQNTAFTVGDPYETFKYDLPVTVSYANASLFKVGESYVVHDSLLGTNPGYSVLTVENLVGSNVDFGVTDISEISSAVPEPSVWALMLAALLMTGGMLRFRRRNVFECSVGAVA
jgi:hypothetical protein